MDILYILIPISICLAAGFLIAFLWSVRNGQYDRIEIEGERIFFDKQSKKINNKKTQI